MKTTLSICNSYFNGFRELSNYKKNSHEINAWMPLKILSYFTIVIPLAFAAIFAAASLYGRVSKKQTLTTQDKVVNDQAKKALVQPATTTPPPPKEIVPAAAQSVAKPAVVVSDAKPKEEVVSDTKPPEVVSAAKPTQQDEIPKYLDIRGAEWLSNEHLDYYFNHLRKNNSKLLIPYGNFAFNSIADAIIADVHFDGKCEHKSWQDCKGKTIIPYRLHVTGNHWTLVLLDREKRTIEYYDPKKNYGNHAEIVEHLKNLAQVLTEKDPDSAPYRFICKIEKSLQPDWYQCGPWVLYFLEERLKNPDVNFNDLDVDQSQSMIAEYRLKVMHTLIANDKK